jgi:hypothetical protein
MKRLFFLLLFFIVCFQFLSATPLDSLKTNKQGIGLIVKVDLFALGVDKFSLHPKRYGFSIEKLLVNRQSVQLSYYFAPYSTFFGKSWYMISSEYKFFVSKKRPHVGYYIGGNLKFIHYYEKSGYIPPQSIADSTFYGKYESYSIGAGVINGVQFYLLKRITIDFLAGIGFLAEVKNKQYQPYYLGNGGRHYYGFAFSPNADVRLAINIGFKF